MALVLSSRTASRADPTVALQQALAGFEGSLTQAQKQEFQTSTAKPDIASVISFVTEIDAKNNGTQRRCVAARLHTFLDATQQFTGIVDTFVSSNPKIAALIWGGIKTTILTANNVASYFDKVTSMIMTIGRSCPAYQEFGQLYHGRVGLQRALCDHYAGIVRLCTKVIEVSQRTALTQTVSSIFVPFESEFKSFLDNLDQATKEIQLQISLASKQANEEAKNLLELESKDNAKFRQWSLKFHKESRREHEDAHQWRVNKMKRDAAKLKSRIRDNLSTTNYVKPWKQAIRQRVPSTAEWLQQEAAFCQWRDGDKSSILWCSGTMGMGKTVLMSNVLAQLHTRRKRDDIIAYYFCRTDDLSSLSARNILGSFARQILDLHLECAKYETLQPLYDQTRDIDAADVVDLILSYVERSKNYYLLLDGLDECENDEIEKVARGLARLYKYCWGFKIICAGRPTLETLLFKAITPDYRVSITEKKVESDMDHYIATLLGRCLEEGQLKLGDPRLIIKISKTLHEGSNGMFLWTHLIIEELCAQGSDNAIIESLDNLPRGLSEIFDRRLNRIRDRRMGKEAIKLLQLCGVVKRPLTLMEYQEALSVCAGQKFLDPRKFPNDMDKVINDSCGLMFADEEDSTVHYIHDSVKKHLFTIYTAHSADFDMTRVDGHLGLLCMTYLDFEDFKGQMMRTKDTSRVTIKPLQFGTFPISQSSNVTSRMALKLLSQDRQLQQLDSQELERKTEEILKDMVSRSREARAQKRDFQFFNYASNYWIDHLMDVDPTKESTWSLFCRFVEGKHVSVKRPWELKENYEEDKDFQALPWILAHGHCGLFLYYAMCQPRHTAEQLIHGMLSLVRSCDRYRFTEKVIEQIVRHINPSRDVLDHALIVACRHGCIDSVTLLLQAGASVDGLDPDTSPLTVAGQCGHLEVVEALLAAGADITAPGSDHGRKALQEATRSGNLRLVGILLEAGADGSALFAGETKQIALQIAAEQGNHEIVGRQFPAAPPPTPSDETAPHDLAYMDQNRMMESLLAAEADKNVPSIG